MHDIEPYWRWRDRYTAEHDDRSPFFGRSYDEFGYSTRCYNYLIHPQWDTFGSPTLYLKILYADYERGACIIELIGEWNDVVHNDIMYLKREVVDVLVRSGIHRFILIGENVLNFHGQDDDYYDEWSSDIAPDDGYIILLNFREHLLGEMDDHGITPYVDGCHDLPDWRRLAPADLITWNERRREMVLGE